MQPTQTFDRKTHWQKNDGDIVVIAEMLDDHLIATIKMIQKKFIANDWTTPLKESFDALKAEADRRGIPIDSDPSKIKPQMKVWTDHRGKQHVICQINVKHLQGILRMLKRAAVMHRAIKVCNLIDPMTADDDALFESAMADASLEDLLRSSWREHMPMADMFESLEKDWFRRTNDPWDDNHEGEAGDLGDLRSSAVKVFNKIADVISSSGGKAKVARSIRL